jgi:endoglucanase Acf2
MVVPVTPPEAKAPLPATDRSGSPYNRLALLNPDGRRLAVRSPLRSTSLPVSADANFQAAKSEARDVRMASHLRTATSASTPASVSATAEYQMRRPLIVRSSTSTSTIFRDTSSSVPPPMSNRRREHDDMVRDAQNREENNEVDDFYKERG